MAIDQRQGRPGDDLTAQGLTAPEAARVLAADGPNELPAAQPRTLARQAWDVIRQPMLVLLLGAGAVNFLLAEPLGGAILLSFVVLVIAISIYQERKTARALTPLRDLSSPQAMVVRDGRRVRIPAMRWSAAIWSCWPRATGYPPDAALVDSVSLSMDESALTGESVPPRSQRHRRLRRPHPYLATFRLLARFRGAFSCSARCAAPDVDRARRSEDRAAETRPSGGPVRTISCAFLP
jgi:magnesium-transporting ATPase (P-type)